MTTNLSRDRRGERLLPNEKKFLRAFLKQCGTKVAAASEIGVTVITLDRLLLTGSGKPETIAKVRLKIAS